MTKKKENGIMKAVKKVLALILVAGMAVGLAGCGEISYDDITGDWTTKTIDGKSVAEYADSYGTTVAMAASNFTITAEDKVTIKNASVSGTYDYERKSNGIEVKEEGKEDILFSMTYDSETNTLSYKVDAGTGSVTCVLEKGTTDLTEDAEDEGDTDTEK
jgi:uncharacterized lipoprotein YehR (DUF1307 family)